MTSRTDPSGSTIASGVPLGALEEAHDVRQDVGSGEQPRLEVSLFGGISLHFDGSRIEVSNRKALALVGYLGLTASLHETRERIVGLLWSEAEEAKARATLRQSLKELRSVFEDCGYTGFATDRVEVGFDPSTIVVDVEAVLASVAAGRPDDALLDRTRITETLLQGFDDIDPSFRVWLLVCRENLHRRLTRALEDQLALSTRGSDEARRSGEALIQLDPTHEGGYQALIECYAIAGDLAGALGIYKKLWDLLDREYDMEPSETSQELIAAIKSGTYVPKRAEPPKTAQATTSTSQAAEAHAPARLVLVVGPFDSEGVPPDRRHIAIGFRYELISRLVRFREWILIDAGPGLAASRPHQDLPHYRITGHILPEQNTVSAILTLQTGPTGQVLWSERCSLALPDFFQTQQNVLHGLATALNVQISAERLARTIGAPDVSLDAFDRWLRGQSLISLYQPPNHERAAQILESIIAESPNFAPAYSGLAQLDNSWHIVFPGIYRTIPRHQRALTHARTAVTLDPLDSRAHLCLAWSHAMNQQFEMAIAAFRYARTLNEYDHWTTTSAALGLAYSGELGEAREFADRALQLAAWATPLHWCYQSTIRLLCGDNAMSVDAAERVGDTINYFLGWRAAALACAGRLQEARAEGRRFLSVIRNVWTGPPEPDDEAITNWLLHCFPFRRAEERERLRAGLLAADLPASAP
jgi:DNA-binding SARP family transcriptional activator